MDRRGRKIKRLVLSLCLLTVVVLAGFHGIGMVKPATLTLADTRDIGYLNVHQDLRIIAASPHPTASPRQTVVRRYLHETMAAMGYRVVEQPFRFTIAEMVNRQEMLYAELNEHQRRAFNAELARVGAAGSFEKEVRIRSGLQDGDSGQGTNLIASHFMPGATGTILFMAHYDSVGTAPGASDDGMAVASILQLMREIIARNDAKNNVIFLLTDGEELGLLGAKYFISQLSTSERDAINLVMNFEARGNQGVPLLFETSPQDYRLMSILNKGVRDIVAFSFTPLIYNMLQNDTDFTAFKRQNVNGLNFAVVEGFEHYHHMSDTVENLPPETLFRYQKMVRKVGQHFIHDVDVSTLSADEGSVYFPLPGGTLLILPLLAVYTLGITLLILCSLWARRCRSQRRYQGKNAVLRPSAIMLLGVFCAALSSWTPTIIYLLTIPVLFLASAMIVRNFYLSSLIMLLGVYVTGILYFPVIYLISSGLQLPLMAGFIALIPLSLWGVGVISIPNRQTSPLDVRRPPSNPPPTPERTP
ncbi:M28 family metallopeptidase [Pseudomonas sp. H3(2019)]|uniref:M28 family metallopeptidase n=1 Tax=Pseudomonas sp. H3(2019) TaxID=2598724 RepID=UPI00119776B9|nr:M28 family metallopeptidase [Pseudomonas sp. H3(2019)]TVT83039.1 Zn-dependent exopeptidase M28 [Pseudomonas sp. H3(2019)]